MNQKQQYIERCKQFVNKFKKDNKTLIRYIRNKRRDPIGVLVAFKDKDNQVCVGGSKCKVKEDRFNRYIGITKAIQRSVIIRYAEDKNYMCLVPDLANTLNDSFDDMVERAKKYFKIQ